MKKLFALSFFLLVGNLTAFSQNPSDEVNLFLGTSGDHGQLSPAACVPFGMIQAGPDSNPRQHPGYDYAQPLISGFSINRLSGVGGQGCGGNISLIPDTCGTGIRILKQTEKAGPGYYRTCLSNGVEVELTATRTTAVERFSFPEGMRQSLILDPTASFEQIHKQQCNILSDKELGGIISAANTCGNGSYTLYYYLHADTPFRADSVHEKIRLDFHSNTDIEIRIAVSPVSIMHAKRHYLGEKNLDFTTIKRHASEKWKQILSRIQIKGSDTDTRTLFYTSLYRTCHSPFQVTGPNDNEYTGTDGQVHKAEHFNYYSSWSLWDTYRTKFPLLSLIVPERMSDMMQSLAHLYITGKESWSTQNECVPTVRTEHAVPLLLDSYLKGFKIPNLKEAWDGMKREADFLPLASPDQCMEAVTDWWALSRLAGILGKERTEKHYARRADSLFHTVWSKEFLHIDSSFTRMRNNGLYQGTCWQYRWAAPQYLDRMIELTGRDTLESQLTAFFDRNLYNQGNEPDIHVPYLFNRLGSPTKTQKTVRDILTKPLTHIYGGNAEYPSPYIGKAFRNAPEGYCPEMDEDDGAMSAWYVFSAIGMYPLIIGEPYYELASPLFEEITLHVSPSKRFVIRTSGRKSMDQPVRKIRLNGKAITDYRVAHADVVKGGVLEFIY